MPRAPRVVTGRGAVTPVGHDAPSTWESAVAGRSEVGSNHAFDATGYPVGIAAEVKEFDPVRVVRISISRARGARVCAEILGYGTSNDATSHGQPDPASVGVAEMMRAACDRAGVEPERVGYVNAH